MDERIAKIFADHEAYFQPKKVEATKEEAYADEHQITLKPGYLKSYHYNSTAGYHERFEKIVYTDEDISAAELKIRFDALKNLEDTAKNTKSIAFWVKFWSVLALIGIGITVLINLVLLF